MRPGIDIWRSANVLIKRYGKDAGFMAAWTADAMLDKGDMDGCRVWTRIVEAIEEMERTKRRVTDPLN